MNAVAEIEETINWFLANPERASEAREIVWMDLDTAFEEGSLSTVEYRRLEGLAERLPE